MEFQMRASGLLYAVTAALPARADVRMEKQSVLMYGRVGLRDMATWIAQSSAAAAVETREGGVPNP